MIWRGRWRDGFSTFVSLAFAAVCCLSVPHSARAFTFSDGSTTSCRDRDGNRVPEIFANQRQQYTGFTTVMQGRWVIIWDPGRLAALPRESHDFIFFHECAHANGSFDELSANCQGLIDMRDAERSSPSIERRIGAYHASLGYMGPQYGYGREYWAKTMQCAGRDDDDADNDDDDTSADDRGSGRDVSTRCRFMIGPRAGQVQDYRGQFAPLPVGTPCNDGYASSGRVVP